MSSEEEYARLRFMAAFLEFQAAWLRLEAAAVTATTACEGLAEAVRQGALADERDLLSFHPDVIELDLKDAAWNPE